MSSTTRFTLLVVGAVAVTLVLAASISAAISTDGSRSPFFTHLIAGHRGTGGEPQPGDERGVPATPAPNAAAVPGAQPTADIDQDDQDDQDGERDRDRDRGATTALTRLSSGDGHGSRGGRDGGRG
jgi:hypothetical protein